jgi:uncharacterized membrane protein HdeD (DUF308 family)
MENSLAHNWWAVALRGVLAILFGLVAFFMPTIAFLSLVLLFGAYALVDGIFAIVTGIRHRQEESRWWVLVLEGLVGIAAGVITFVFPPATALALVYVIAAWSLVTGVLEMIAAVRLRKEITGEWMLFLTGVLSVIVGLGMAIFPGPAAIAIVWVIASYAIVFGVLMLILAFRLRGLQHRGTASAAPRTT